ncbi:MAG: bifunctional methylenetetrahydrofolate dehydrogenase/methenyltetrahydrofolate cyclohydrolase FolD [Pseudomonadota bacterium]
MDGAKLIDGKAIAAGITEAVARDAAVFQENTGAPPCLAVVLVGDNPASAVYVRNKGKTANKIGFRSIQKTLPADTSEAEIVSVIEKLNDDPTVNGILVQLPLPDHVDSEKILDLVDPKKDVDGFHPINVGRLASGLIEKALVPCTPAGCVILAREALGDLTGKHVVVIGRSNIVGKPVAQLFLNENCTVTIAHSRTQDLPAVARGADILIAAVGRPQMVKADWVKPGACVIDVGINRIDAPEKGEGKMRLVGDVDFDSVSRVAGAITPVPGGVGPMTIAMLMKNTLTAAQRQAS